MISGKCSGTRDFHFCNTLIFNVLQKSGVKLGMKMICDATPIKDSHCKNVLFSGRDNFSTQNCAEPFAMCFLDVQG